MCCKYFHRYPLHNIRSLLIGEVCERCRYKLSKCIVFIKLLIETRKAIERRWVCGRCVRMLRKHSHLWWTTWGIMVNWAGYFIARGRTCIVPVFGTIGITITESKERWLLVLILCRLLLVVFWNCSRLIF